MPARQRLASPLAGIAAGLVHPRMLEQQIEAARSFDELHAFTEKLGYTSKMAGDAIHLAQAAATMRVDANTDWVLGRAKLIIMALI